MVDDMPCTGLTRGERRDMQRLLPPPPPILPLYPPCAPLYPPCTLPLPLLASPCVPPVSPSPPPLPPLYAPRPPPPGPASLRCSSINRLLTPPGQGLTLVQFSAQPEPF